MQTEFLCSNVHRRGTDGRFYFRVRVPPDLVPVLQAKELRFSLRTKSLAEAMSCADGIRKRLKARSTISIHPLKSLHVTDLRTGDYIELTLSGSACGTFLYYVHPDMQVANQPVELQSQTWRRTDSLADTYQAESSDGNAVEETRGKPMATKKPDETQIKVNLHKVTVSVKKVSSGQEQHIRQYKAGLLWVYNDGIPSINATGTQQPQEGTDSVEFLASESSTYPKGLAIRVTVLANDMAVSVTEIIGPVTTEMAFVVLLYCPKDVFDALA